MDHKDLDVWKKSMDLVEEIYRVTKEFPDHERYGLTNQIRRSAVSIPSNIAEGSGRKGDKELLQFLSFALGSLAEVETQLIIAVRLVYVNEIDSTLDLITEVRKLTLGYRNYILKKSKL
ncbi:four helix bundle protein [Antarcticibacterium arcticum]|uniref:Four helix bundle protein n=1 Tax=Antarcticibacterium arcticum TaxID=2585771 RepID=A0A5B8YJ84_9FLAO|nr:four helix bundle protein [Antarcticibacterium arcticum]QED37785.1 four helix bundle protein [Antarcticibacterium arcticum]